MLVRPFYQSAKVPIEREPFVHVCRNEYLRCFQAFIRHIFPRTALAEPNESTPVFCLDPDRLGGRTFRRRMLECSLERNAQCKGPDRVEPHERASSTRGSKSKPNPLR